MNDNLDVFNKCVQDIINCDGTMSKTYKIMILLNSKPYTYKEIKNFNYDGDTITPEIVIDFLKSKEMKINTKKRDKKSGKIYMMGVKHNLSKIV